MLSSNLKVKSHRVQIEADSISKPLQKLIGSKYDKALLAARRYVSRGVYSVLEVREYLKNKGVDNREADQFIIDAEAHNQLHDPTSGRLWAEQYARKFYSWYAIRTKLIAKGFSTQLVEKLGNTLKLATSDETRARDFWMQLQNADARHVLNGETNSIPSVDEHNRSRIIRRLIARGFDTELVNKLMEEPITGDS